MHHFFLLAWPRLKRFSSRAVAFLILFSLAFGTTNPLDRSLVEASSPEDKLQQPLPSFDPSAQLQSPGSLYSSQPNDSQPKSGEQPKSLPILTPNVFPYQPNPIAAIVAAGLTLAVVSLKETGTVDVQSILWLLNNSDYYAGIIGSVVHAYSQKQASQFVATAISRSMTQSPKVLKPIFDNQAAKAFGNIINGFTYTFAVSSGFEVFSQFWKYATKNIPEVRTMTGLLHASNAKRKQVIGNLLYYCVQDGNMQKRLVNSVYNHRIMTYEFIATNVAMYIGGQVGAILAKKYGADHPILSRIAPVIGSISGGLIVQAIPDSWKGEVNRALLDYKISNSRKNLNEALARIDEYVDQRIYPRENRELSGYLMSGTNLSSDINRVFRARDMLNSLEFEKMSYEEKPQAIFDEIRSDQKSMRDTFEKIRANLEESKNLSRSEQIDQWVQQKKTPEEIEQLSRRLKSHDPVRDYYQILIEAAMDRIQVRSDEIEGLFIALEKAPPHPDLSEVIFDMATSNK